MAQQAYNYNNIYGYYNAPNTAPEMPVRGPKAPQGKPKIQAPELKKVKRTKAQAIEENKRKFKRFLLKWTVILSVFAAMFAIAANSNVKKNEAITALAAAKSNYTETVKKNNELKLQLNSFMSKMDIDKIAKDQLGLVKIEPGDEYYLGEESE